MFNYICKIWDKKLLNIQEQVYLIYLNDSNEVISWRSICTGTSSNTLFDIKFGLSCALNCLASKIIIAHNHPSGILKPSKNDINMTQKLYTAANILDMTLIDHLIINRLTYYSFADNNLL